MKKIMIMIPTIFLLIIILGFATLSHAGCPNSKTHGLGVSHLGSPSYFVENKGQIDKCVSYYMRGKQGTIYFTEKTMIFDLLSAADSHDINNRRRYRDKTKEFKHFRFRQEFLKSERDVQLITGKQLPGRINYLIGKDSGKWHTDIEIYDAVIYKELYKGIDLRVYGNQQQIECDFIVHPGAKPDQIHLSFFGVNGLEIVKDGSLVAQTAMGKMALYQKPFIYQEEGGKRHKIEGGFSLKESHTFGFDVGTYDKSLPLVIDPVTLIYSTYLGGYGIDEGNAIAADADGAVYITGYTFSADFPVENSLQDININGVTNVHHGPGDVFVTKLNASGDALVYSTYLGGSNDDRGYGIALDASGAAYITGKTNSGDFPTTVDALQPTQPGGIDGFMAKLSPSGDALVYSTYLGGTFNDEGYGIAVDGAQGAYVTGYTDSSDFPVTQGAFQTIHGCHSNSFGCPPVGAPRAAVFVAKFVQDGSALDYSTFLGGMWDNKGREIAVDSSGAAYVTGNCDPYFPVTAGAFDTEHNGFTEGFVTKLNPSGDSLAYSSFLGAYPYTEGYGIAVDGDGAAYVTGYTTSGSFPTTENAFQKNYAGGVWGDAFVSKVTPSGHALIYSTYLGGGDDDLGHSIAVDASGAAHVTGYTWSNDFPLERPFQGAIGLEGNADAFVTKMAPEGDGLGYSTYLGGRLREEGKGIALDPEGSSYVTGFTDSENFPLVDPFQENPDTTIRDAFVAKLDFWQTLGVAFIGQRRFSPGDKVDYLIEYYNDADGIAENTVLKVILPLSAKYVSSSNNGVCLWTAHKVFWQLGNLPSGSKGVVRLTVEYEWGLQPHSLHSLIAEIDSTTIVTDRIPEIENYLFFDPLTVISEERLDEEALEILLSQNQELQELYDYVVDLGFEYYDGSQKTVYSNGEEEYLIPVLQRDPFEVIVICSYSQTAIAVKFSNTGYSLLNRDGGLSLDFHTRTLISWGTWSQTHSPAFVKCLLNCAISKGVADFLAYMLKSFSYAQLFTDAYNCIQYGSREACEKTLYGLIATAAKKFPIVQTGTTIHGLAASLYYCALDCIQDPNSHNCKEGDVRKVCSVVGMGSFIDEHIRKHFNRDVLITYRCVKGYKPIGGTFWELWGNRTYCKKGMCEMVWDKKTKSMQARCKTCSPSCSLRFVEAITAHDPNAKYGFSGNVLPGQELNYIIEYENEGEGTAYGVFIVDQLDENLDEATLTIEDGGAYDPSARTITWEIGDLAAQQGGQVSFSVNVGGTVPSGTEIVNFAKVHFPSVPEITPTNPILNMVDSIVAHPQELEVEAGVNLPITLTGVDAGSASLSYRIMDEPLYGELSGIPPNLTYVSMEGFNGLDKFSFVVNNGIKDSERAEVRILVLPSSSDIIPPMVEATIPDTNAIDVPVSSSPLVEDEDMYLPIISARFSEPIDPETVDETSFVVDGISGTIGYDVLTRTAYFLPALPLLHDTTYTARITVGVKDNSGNPMAQDYIWQFTTNTERDIKVYLRPPHMDNLDFGSVDVLSISEPETVTIMSSGEAYLTLGDIILTGSHAGDFTIETDDCTNSTLAPAEGCTVTIVFNPTSGGTKNAILSIASDDPNNPIYEVPITGEGVAIVSEKQICSILGNDPKPSILDQDIYEFYGTEGEEVTVKLQEAVGNNTGDRATLILRDRIPGVWLFKMDRTVLPNEIATILPATGRYRVLVNEQPLIAKGERFRGNYCVTLQSSQDAWQTFEPTGWVE